jgi:hypothetical protein
MKKDYIITFADDGPEIFGPFETDAELRAFGTGWQLSRGDDPRWHSISLDPSFIGGGRLSIEVKSCAYGA